jgi:hypothetical protein
MSKSTYSIDTCGQCYKILLDTFTPVMAHFPMILTEGTLIARSNIIMPKSFKIWTPDPTKFII